MERPLLILIATLENGHTHTVTEGSRLTVQHLNSKYTASFYLCVLISNVYEPFFRLCGLSFYMCAGSLVEASPLIELQKTSFPSP